MTTKTKIYVVVSRPPLGHGVTVKAFASEIDVVEFLAECTDWDEEMGESRQLFFKFPNERARKMSNVLKELIASCPYGAHAMWHGTEMQDLRAVEHSFESENAANMEMLVIN